MIIKVGRKVQLAELEVLISKIIAKYEYSRCIKNVYYEIRVIIFKIKEKKTI